MINCNRVRRLSSIAFALAALVGASGCQQMSAWTNMSPRVSTPSAAPFGHSPSSDTYFHRPDAAPLTPVPDLPGPGHSVPLDLPPPPAPSEGVNSPKSLGDAVTTRSKALWNMRPMSFFRRKDERSDTFEAMQATTRTSTESPSQAAVKTDRVSASPNIDRARSNIERASSRLNNPAFATNASGNPTSYEPIRRPSGPKIIVTPSQQPAQLPTSTLGESHTGPVITPGAQYTIERETPIESWPHARAGTNERATANERTNANDRAAIHFRRQPPKMSADAFAPTEPAGQSLQFAPPSAGAATVPLLLPPGP